MMRQVLRSLPGARPLARRLRLVWESTRPIPLPRYEAGTPKLGGGGSLDPYFPPTALTLGASAMSEEAANFVAGVLDRLTPGRETARGQFLYRWGQGKFGKHWRYADLLTVLCAAAYCVRPSSYLEIGVRRGRSAAVVAAMWPKCAIYGFDLWIPAYGGAPNPGPDFVRNELRAVGHAGSVVLAAGDSRETVPAFLREHPDLYFDLITVDGDHSLLGAATDPANTLPRLKVGGVIAFDDLRSAPQLARVWERLVKSDSRYATWEFTDAGYGVAAAVRVSDEGAPRPAT